MRILLLKTWRDLLARKGQFFGLVFLVMLGISTFVAFLGAFLDLNASVELATERLKLADFSVHLLNGPASAVRQVERVPGVEAVEGRFVGDTGLDLGDDQQATARVIGTPTERRPRVNDVEVIEGRYLRPGARDEALLQTKFANETGTRPGDELVLRFGEVRRRVRVVGIVASAEYMYPIRTKGELPAPREFAVLWVPEKDAEEMFGRPGGITDVSVLVQRGADTARVVAEVEDELERFRITETVERADQASYFAIQEELEQNRVLSIFMPALILAISSSSLLIALSRLVQSQRGEIGLAKALGYSDLQMLVHYLLYSLVIAVGGSLLGIGLGDLMARGIAAQYGRLLGVPFLTHHVYWNVTLGAVAISSAACVAAGMAPAWRSSRLPPAQAMHSDPNLQVAGGRIPLVERLLGWALPATFTVRIPLRNVFRAKRRSVYTVVGIAFAMVLTVATVSSFDSIEVLFDTVFTRTERWDVLAVYEAEFGASRVAEVRRWAGVERVQPAFLLPAEVRSTGGLHEGLLTAMEPTADFHGFEIAEGPPASEALAGGGLVIAEPVAQKLGVTVGDSVSVKTPFRDERTQVRIGAISRETLGAPSFVSLETAKELVGAATTEYNSLYLDVEAGRAAQIRDDLYDLPGAISVTVKADMVSRLQELLAFSYFYEALLLGFGFAMAFVVIYNTFTANVLERTREIATMRTIGESNGRLAVMVTLENLFLAVAGVPLGIWLGVRTTDAMYAQFSSEAYSLQAVIRPLSVAWVVASIVAVMLVSEIPPVRRIFKMDLAEATKVME